MILAKIRETGELIDLIFIDEANEVAVERTAIIPGMTRVFNLNDIEILEEGK